MDATHPATTHSRNAMWESISRNDGHALDGENDKAKITATPVSRVAKNATLNCTESITSWRASGAATATASRIAAQPVSAARRALCGMPRIQATAALAHPGTARPGGPPCGGTHWSTSTTV